MNTSVYNYDSLVEKLKHNICQVTFTKVDGTTREMRCTLQPLYLPEANRNEVYENTNHDVIRVFDLEINEWRAFRLNSVTCFYVPTDQNPTAKSLTSLEI
jgi:hypothetical protein